MKDTITETGQEANEGVLRTQAPGEVWSPYADVQTMLGTPEFHAELEALDQECLQQTRAGVLREVPNA